MRDKKIKVDVAGIRTAIMKNEGFAYHAVMVQFERALLEQVMKRYHGNVSKSAEVLGIHRSTLMSKLKACGLERNKNSNWLGW